MSDKVCTHYDGFLQEVDRAIWYVELNDGSNVYGDDYRYGENDIAFRRLKNYLKNNNLKINKIFVKFRSHVELAQERNDETIGWYFGRGVGCWVGQPTQHKIITGQVQSDGTVRCKIWQIPEVILSEEDSRKSCDYLENIIWDEECK